MAQKACLHINEKKTESKTLRKKDNGEASLIVDNLIFKKLIISNILGVYSQ